MVSIRRARPADATAVADLMARAFRNDPVMSHIWPDDADRGRRLGRYFVSNLRHHHLRDGVVDLAYDGDELIGVAVWDPPGCSKPTATHLIRSLPTILPTLGTRLTVALKVRRAVDAAHPQQPHWYMCLLATEPQSQRSGTARALLAHGHARCDSKGEAAFGAATGSHMRPFYRALGYRDINVPIDLGPSGPQVWPLWRDPQPQHSLTDVAEP